MSIKKDKIIQISTTKDEENVVMIYGLSESGVLYYMDTSVAEEWEYLRGSPSK